MKLPCQQLPLVYKAGKFSQLTAVACFESRTIRPTSSNGLSVNPVRPANLQKSPAYEAGEFDQLMGMICL
jgi:hypothetical protein